MLKHYKYVYQKLKSIQPELTHLFYYDEHIDQMEASSPPEDFIIDSSIPSEAQGDYCLMSFLVSSVSYDLPDDVLQWKMYQGKSTAACDPKQVHYQRQLIYTYIHYYEKMMALPLPKIIQERFKLLDKMTLANNIYRMDKGLNFFGISYSATHINDFPCLCLNLQHDFLIKRFSAKHPIIQFFVNRDISKQPKIAQILPKNVVVFDLKSTLPLIPYLEQPILKPNNIIDFIKILHLTRKYPNIN